MNVWLWILSLLCFSPSLPKRSTLMNCEDTTSKLSVSLKITKVLGVGKCVGLFMLSAWNQITQATLSNSTSVIGRVACLFCLIV